jgi:hypothetical protein
LYIHTSVLLSLSSHWAIDSQPCLLYVEALPIIRLCHSSSHTGYRIAVSTY